MTKSIFALFILTLSNVFGAVEPASWDAIPPAKNFPIIKELVLAVFQDNTNKPDLYQFRYQTGGFYARKLKDIYSAWQPASPDEPQAGYWDNDYWSVDPLGTLSSLHSYTYQANDTGATAFQNSHRMEKCFSFFATYGITGEGLNAVTKRGEYLQATNDYGLMNSAKLVLSNGVPITGAMDYEMKVEGIAGKRTIRINMNYHYLATLAPLPIPIEITQTQVAPDQKTYPYMRFRVIKLELSEQLLSRDYFSPDLTSIKSNQLSRVIYTNGQNFAVLGGKLTSMSGSKKDADARLHGRVPAGKAPPKSTSKWWVIALILVPVLVVLGVVITKKRKQ